MRKEEGKGRLIHGDNINVLAKEVKPFTIKRFGEQISILIISVNKLKSESTIFDKLPNVVMLNRIFRAVNGTGIVTIDGKMFLMNTIIKENFLHPWKLGAATIGSDVFSLCNE